jgi:hypothetical protein
MQHRHKERRPSRADRRAADWVNNTGKKTLSPRRVGKPEEETLHTAYIARRKVDVSTPLGIFARKDMQKLLRSGHGARVFPHFLASLVDPRQGREIATSWEGTQDELHEAFETAAGALPTTRSGFLLHAIIVGARNGRPGPRYPSFLVDGPLQSIMREDRARLIDTTGQPYINDWKYTPHITMLETTDPDCAQALNTRMEGLLTVAQIPVELGEIDVVPIPNTRRISS